ncbi:hypothetical protein NEOLEDRAFT_348265 [Neolentinus lepideus HHB14362 ss-1]|uniref:Uncharacterized protein n=1 Tax=Neolentinus lepideus HHB14362 ss-1 TaxID=1314782 RepID=A0A165SQX6_9AGAM|nr:hypothetical protein NEOLEDRAFT_348265 [Neolentinus lepideus HHB14362 ss-1]
MSVFLNACLPRLSSTALSASLNTRLGLSRFSRPSSALFLVFFNTSPVCSNVPVGLLSTPPGFLQRLSDSFQRFPHHSALLVLIGLPKRASSVFSTPHRFLSTLHSTLVSCRLVPVGLPQHLSCFIFQHLSGLFQRSCRSPQCFFWFPSTPLRFVSRLPSTLVSACLVLLVLPLGLIQRLSSLFQRARRSSSTLLQVLCQLLSGLFQSVSLSAPPDFLQRLFGLFQRSHQSPQHSSWYSPTPYWFVSSLPSVSSARLVVFDVSSSFLNVHSNLSQRSSLPRRSLRSTSTLNSVYLNVYFDLPQHSLQSISTLRFSLPRRSLRSFSNVGLLQRARRATSTLLL